MPFCGGVLQQYRCVQTPDPDCGSMKRVIRASLIVAALIIGYLFYRTFREQQSTLAALSGVQATPYLQVTPPPMLPGKRTVVETKKPDSFFLPGLGDIKCVSRPTSSTYRDGHRNERSLAMKVFYSETGNFLRAEYTDETKPSYEAPRHVRESNYRVSAETLAGFPENAASISLGQLLQAVYDVISSEGTFENASKLDITFVNLVREGRYAPPGEPVFIVNSYGAGLITQTLPKGREDLKRIRYVFSRDGKLLWMDNNI